MALERHFSRRSPLTRLKELAEKVAETERNEGGHQRLVPCKANQWFEILFATAASDAVTRIIVKNATLRGAGTAYASFAHVAVSPSSCATASAGPQFFRSSVIMVLGKWRRANGRKPGRLPHFQMSF